MGVIARGVRAGSCAVWGRDVSISNSISNGLKSSYVEENISSCCCLGVGDLLRLSSSLSATEDTNDFMLDIGDIEERQVILTFGCGECVLKLGGRLGTAEGLTGSGEEMGEENSEESMSLLVSDSRVAGTISLPWVRYIGLFESNESGICTTMKLSVELLAIEAVSMLDMR